VSVAGERVVASHLNIGTTRIKGCRVTPTYLHHRPRTPTEHLRIHTHHCVVFYLYPLSHTLDTDTEEQYHQASHTLMASHYEVV